MSNIIDFIKETISDQNNVKSFLGVPVTELSNYKPWMDNKEISKYYQVVPDENGKKKVTLSKELSADDFEIYNKDQFGNDMSSIDGDKLGMIFNLATTRYNSEAGADDATGIQQINRYPSFDTINQLGVTKDLIGDYINAVINPDTPTDKIQSPAMNGALTKKLNGQDNAVFSDLSSTYLGSIKNFSANQGLTDSVSRSLFDTVISVKKEQNPMYVGADMMPMQPLSGDETSNLYQQYKDDSMVVEADRAVKDMLKYNKGTNKSQIADSINKMLTNTNSDGSSLDPSLATSLAMHNNGLGKYAPISMSNEDGVVKYSSTSSIEGIPVYDPNKGYYVRTNRGDVPIMEDQLADSVKKMAMDNNILQKGSGAYRTRGDMYANYGGRINIPTSLLPPEQ